MSILDKIVATKRQEIAAARVAVPVELLRERLRDAPPVRDFFAAVSGGDTIRLIAEVKKASPSKGVIRADFEPVGIAQAYARNGASCISVLTDTPYFQGALEYLTAIRDAVTLPVLRKDFLIDSYQLLEARAAGADAVLLIAECLDDGELRELHQESLDLGMTPLVECYAHDNLSRVLEMGAELIGINNRNLRTFDTDLQHTIRMRREIPPDCVVVGESGIHSREDVLLLQAAGVNAILVGEYLMSQPDVGLAVKQLLGTHDSSAV